MKKAIRYSYSRWGYRRKLKICACGGTVWEYEAVGFIPKIKKCDRCGRGY